MYITYHKSVECPEGLSSIPHQLLCSAVQKFITENNCLQKFYKVKSNSYYFFIYLNNGDRIDVAL